MRRNTVISFVVSLALGVAACGGGSGTGSVADKIAKEHRVTVGTKWDQPGLGLKTGTGDPKGFDVDVAKYVIKELSGGQHVGIEWKE